MPVPHDFLALAAATCWAVGAILSVTPARHLGTFAFNRWRMFSVALMLWTVTFVSGGPGSLSPWMLTTMAISGLVGIFVGDSALFAAMNRLGPRRAGVLFALHAVFSAALGFVFLGERMGLQAALGAALTLSGVMTAVLLGRRREEDHAWESDRGPLVVGVALGLLSALCQAVGTFIAKPVMAAGMDPFVASAIRTTVSCAAHFVLLWAGFAGARAHQPLTPRMLGQTALNGFIGMGLGMSCLLWALRYGDVGTVAILSSVSPVVVLPLLWWRLGRAPAPGAWVGAGLTVLGTALILSR
ncbi:MAG: DMT family transporter [Moraxellaceae bacterium]|nr:DMT family transporter [Moraxellaceae bacterium]